MWKIYHNPNCTKSRECLAKLEAKNLKPEVVQYLKQPPTVAELKMLAKKLGLRAREFTRTKEEAAAGLDLDDEEKIFAAIAKHPILLERPIIVHGERAVVGRPTEKLDVFLSEEL